MTSEEYEAFDASLEAIAEDREALTAFIAEMEARPDFVVDGDSGGFVRSLLRSAMQLRAMIVSAPGRAR